MKTDVVNKQTRPVLIKVTPATISHGDELTISLPLPHPENLAIVAPDGTMYYLHDPGSKVFLPLSKDFSELKIVKIDTSQLIAAYWTNGEKKHGPVFKSTGKYKVLVADNLEEVDDGESAQYIVEINYKAAK